MIRRKFRWVLHSPLSCKLNTYVAIDRTCCRALHCCTRSTCIPFYALGWAMACSRVPVPVGWSIRKSMRRLSSARPSRAICVSCIEPGSGLWRSYASSRSHQSLSTPRSWWPSVHWILCVVGGYCCLLGCGACSGCGRRHSVGKNFKHLSWAFCVLVNFLGCGWRSVALVYFCNLLWPFYKKDLLHRKLLQVPEIVWWKSFAEQSLYACEASENVNMKYWSNWKISKADKKS